MKGHTYSRRRMTPSADTSTLQYRRSLNAYLIYRAHTKCLQHSNANKHRKALSKENVHGIVRPSRPGRRFFTKLFTAEGLTRRQIRRKLSQMGIA